MSRFIFRTTPVDNSSTSDWLFFAYRKLENQKTIEYLSSLPHSENGVGWYKDEKNTYNVLSWSSRIKYDSIIDIRKVIAIQKYNSLKACAILRGIINLKDVFFPTTNTSSQKNKFSNEIVAKFISNSDSCAYFYNENYIPSFPAPIYKPVYIVPQVLNVLGTFCNTTAAGDCSWCLAQRVPVFPCGYCKIGVCAKCFSKYMNADKLEKYIPCKVCNTEEKYDNGLFKSAHYVVPYNHPSHFHFSKTAGCHSDNILKIVQKLIETPAGINPNLNQSTKFDESINAILNLHLDIFNGGEKKQIPNLMDALLNFKISSKKTSAGLHKAESYFKAKKGEIAPAFCATLYSILQNLQDRFFSPGGNLAVTPKAIFEVFQNYDGNIQFMNPKLEIKTAKIDKGVPSVSSSERLFMISCLLLYIIGWVDCQNEINKMAINNPMVLKTNGIHGQNNMVIQRHYVSLLKKIGLDYTYLDSEQCDRYQSNAKVERFVNDIKENIGMVTLDFAKFDLNMRASVIIGIMNKRAKMFYDFKGYKSNSFLPQTMEGWNLCVWIAACLFVVYSMSYKIINLPSGSGYFSKIGSLASGLFYTTYFNSLANFITTVCVIALVLNKSVLWVLENFKFSFLGDDVFFTYLKRLVTMSNEEFKNRLIAEWKVFGMDIPQDEFFFHDEPFHIVKGTNCPDFLKNKITYKYCKYCKLPHFINYRDPEHIFGKLFKSSNVVLSTYMLALKCNTVVWCVGADREVYDDLKYIYDLCLLYPDTMYGKNVEDYVDYLDMIMGSEEIEEDWVKEKIKGYALERDQIAHFPSYEDVFRFHGCIVETYEDTTPM